MISVQPIQINTYITDRKIDSVVCPYEFYISWEDALWDVIRSFEIPNKSLILVPSFFCVDVMKNMKSHGLCPQYYDVDKNFQADPQLLFEQIKKLRPAFLVLFHAVGIQNKCVNKEFISSLPTDIIVIEDSVHCIVEPHSVEIYSSNHIVITSLRKVVPLQGSFLFGTKVFVRNLRGADKSSHLYSWPILFLWWIMQFCLSIQMKAGIFASYWGRVAELVMLWGYSIIGDRKEPGYCPKNFEYAYLHINFQHVKSIKNKQVEYYEKYLKKSLHYKVPDYTNRDKKELRGFPIIMLKKPAKFIIDYMREKGILIRAELDDSKWTKKRSIMYLPLGPHVEIEDIKTISTIFNRAVSSVHNTSRVYYPSATYLL